MIPELRPCSCRGCHDRYNTRRAARGLVEYFGVRRLGRCCRRPTALQACCGFDLSHKYILYFYLYLDGLARTVPMSGACTSGVVSGLDSLELDIWYTMSVAAVNSAGTGDRSLCALYRCDARARAPPPPPPPPCASAARTPRVAQRDAVHGVVGAARRQPRRSGPSSASGVPCVLPRPWR